MSVRGDEDEGPVDGAREGQRTGGVELREGSTCEEIFTVSGMGGDLRNLGRGNTVGGWVRIVPTTF